MSNQLINSKPDFNRFLKAVTRSGVPDRVPFFEIFSQLHQQTLDYIKEKDPQFEWICPPEKDCDERIYEFKRHISYMYALGYDYCTIIPEFEFYKTMHHSDITKRDFLTTTDVMIKNRDDFKNYNWPEVADTNVSLFENAGDYMPDGMKIVLYSRGPYLATLYLLGYEGICYLLADDEELVRDTLNATGERVLELYTKGAKFDNVGALAIGEDLAFYSGTYLPPKFLRKYVFPWYEKIVKVCHENNKPIIFHSCGNNEAVMEDLIACGFDAKHSFEDKIIPVWESKKKWGDRLTLMGGFDMHKLCEMNPEEIKAHTELLFEKCKPGGGWTFGSGNSIADYVPLENFITMITEGHRLGSYI